jgi:hypothetical protein
MSFTEINHYVPQWYQRRFIPAGRKEQKFYYLDLKPDRLSRRDGSSYYREEIRRLGPAKCFAHPHLYTLFFGQYAADVIEKRFFGEIDRLGARAVEFFSHYEVTKELERALTNLMHHLSAQKFRTPKGLDFIKHISQSAEHQVALQLMGKLWKLYKLIWLEGVWEIVECDRSNTKFIISDHPVTTYNKKLSPLSPECQYPFDASIELVGTHTIHPLSLNRCLIITNLGYVRNPEIDLLSARENLRYFGETLFDLRSVQTGRQISEDYVRAINFIIKNRAGRYIAAAEREWLNPEKFLGTTSWDNLNDEFFLMPDPRKVRFVTGSFAEFTDGSVFGMDEYGRPPRDHDEKVKAYRDIEFKAFEESKKAWDDRFGKISVEELRRYF